MDSIKNWRPATFSEIIGEANRRTVYRLQHAAIQRRPLAGLLLGPYGSAKTSVAQLLMKSYVCQYPDTETGIPCGKCQHCRSIDPDHNGESHTFQHWEIDCSQPFSRDDIGQLVEEAQSRIWPAFIIFDEFHRLSERSAQDVLLKYAESIRQGVLLAIVMTEPNRPAQRSVRIKPALFDRLKKFYVSIPEADEVASFLWEKLPAWEIDSTREVLNELVARSERSFRTCLSILDDARHINGGVLDLELIDDNLPECQRDWQDCEDPFADDEEEDE